MAYVNPFAPLIGTLQSTGLYLIIWGSNLTTVNAATTVCITYQPTNTSSCGTQTAVSLNGFHLTSAWAPGPSQINIPYYVDATATTGSYSLKVTTLGGSSSWSFTISPYREVTVIGWVNGVVPLPPDNNLPLIDDLNSVASCEVDIAAWAIGGTKDLFTAADRAYASSFLISKSGNPAPPNTITPSNYLQGGNFRLFNDYGNPNRNTSVIGATPDPCGSGLTISAQSSQYNGSTGKPATGLPYLLAEGRLGTTGQAINETLNNTTTPWIWSVIEFAASGVPIYNNFSIFPTISVYVNGSLVLTNPQAPVATFSGLNQSYQLTPPPNP